MSAYCQWHDCLHADVSEHQYEQCEAQGWDCKDCPYFGDEADQQPAEA